jgi:hypothetical protein
MCHLFFVCFHKYYGGLGDEVAIFTSSPTSGGLALRHELGHILADVGEGDYFASVVSSIYLIYFLLVVNFN